MQVSIVIPAFNEGERLPAFLHGLVRELTRLAEPTVQVLVVDDGSDTGHRDLEARAVEETQRWLTLQNSGHQVLFLPNPLNRGKAASIRLGWERCPPEAEWLGFVDADGAVSPQELVRLVRQCGDGPSFDLLAGSRIRLAGRRIDRSPFRHLQGRVFATLTEWVLGLGFYDTQCGVKLARAPLVRNALPLLEEQHWLLDVELLAFLKLGGAVLREEPIDWTDAPGSKVSVGIDAVRMFWGLRRVRRRLEQASRKGYTLPATTS